MNQRSMLSDGQARGDRQRDERKVATKIKKNVYAVRIHQSGVCRSPVSEKKRCKQVWWGQLKKSIKKWSQQ